MIPTRLDSVVRLREREEEKAAQAVGRAERAVHSAMAKVEAAHDRAMADFRVKNDISQWELQELAQHRAVAEEKKAQREAEAARQAALQVRSVYTRAHQRAEVVRRVSETRRDEAQREESRLETKNLDDVAAMMFVRKTG
jgi:flagellar biosynthesis chaperone FliJ